MRQGSVSERKAMKIILIRHGTTKGNLEKRYIGATDEPLCETGRRELLQNTYPDCDRVIVSPMKRCVETARLIYPEKEHILCHELRECHFGDFEGKNHNELDGSPIYQSWIDSGGMGDFPNGERPHSFKQRSIRGFEISVSQAAHQDIIAFVIHGGNIMAIMEKYARPHREFYEWYVKNGHGCLCDWDGEKLTLLEQI